MISLQGASRWYGQVLGINDVTCQIGPGITALLGPNGAGKSTMLKLITGQLRPTAGRVTVLGMAPFASRKVAARLGYCPEHESGWEEFTGRQFVMLMGRMAGLTGSRLTEEVDRSIERVRMTHAADRKIGGYSKGMRQRIKIAQAIVHNPDLLILDEPLNGLDPVGRREISALMREIGAEGKCVVVSSHILYEVEQMTHSILLMHHGRMLAQGDVYQIRDLIDSHPHRVAITTDEPRRLAARLLELPYVVSVKFPPEAADRMEVEIRSPERFYEALPGIVLAADFHLKSFTSPDNNLEAVFKYLVESRV